MRNLEPGTYADLREGRRLVVAIARCNHCAPKGFANADHVARHNLHCALEGERAYPVKRAA